MPEAYSGESESPERRGSLVLVVEDDSRTLRLERFILEEEGFEVAEAGSGEEASQLIQKGGPALVLLDIGLPGIDGFTTGQRIREFSQVLIIMVAAEDRDEDKVRGLEMGADDYVTKPFSTTELSARVKAVLRRYDFTAGPVAETSSQQALGRLGGTRPAGGRVPGEASRGPAGTLDAHLYEGAVRLVVETTGSIRTMIHFVDELRQNLWFHLLSLVANQSKEGMDIKLRLREPIALKSALLRMRAVSYVGTPLKTAATDDEQLLQVSLGA